MKFKSINNLFNRIQSDLGDYSKQYLLNHIGRACASLSMTRFNQSVVAPLVVENHSALLPDYLIDIHQVAKYNGSRDIIGVVCDMNDDNDDDYKMSCDIDLNCGSNCDPCGLSCYDDLLENMYGDFYVPRFDFITRNHIYSDSSYLRREFTPIRKATSSFFLSNEKTTTENGDKYSVINGMHPFLRFSFESGIILLSYYRTPLDDKNIPLIYADYNYESAIFYYIKWQIAQKKNWEGIEGFERKAANAERLWLKYRRLALENAMMPKGVDEYMNLLGIQQRYDKQGHEYNNFFGNIAE